VIEWPKRPSWSTIESSAGFGDSVIKAAIFVALDADARAKGGVTPASEKGIRSVNPLIAVVDRIAGTGKKSRRKAVGVIYRNMTCGCSRGHSSICKKLYVMRRA
jgi:hypothetical protein